MPLLLLFDFALHLQLLFDFAHHLLQLNFVKLPHSHHVLFLFYSLIYVIIIMLLIYFHFFFNWINALPHFGLCTFLDHFDFWCPFLQIHSMKPNHISCDQNFVCCCIPHSIAVSRMIFLVSHKHELSSSVFQLSTCVLNICHCSCSPHVLKWFGKSGHCPIQCSYLDFVIPSIVMGSVHPTYRLC